MPKFEVTETQRVRRTATWIVEAADEEAASESECPDDTVWDYNIRESDTDVVALDEHGERIPTCEKCGMTLEENGGYWMDEHGHLDCAGGGGQHYPAED